MHVGLPDWVDKRLKQSADALKAALYVPVELSSDPSEARVTSVDEEDVLTPTTVWLLLGKREITLERVGYQPAKKTLQLDEVRAQPLHVILEPIPSPQPEVRQIVAPAIVQKEAPPPPRSRLRPIGGATLGAGAALLGVSLTLYLVAREVATPDANMQTRGTPAFNDALDRFHGEYYSSIALLAVGGALAIGGIAVLAASAKKKR